MADRAINLHNPKIIQNIAIIAVRITGMVQISDFMTDVLPKFCKSYLKRLLIQRPKSGLHRLHGNRVYIPAKSSKTQLMGFANSSAGTHKRIKNRNAGK